MFVRHAACGEPATSFGVAEDGAAVMDLIPRTMSNRSSHLSIRESKRSPMSNSSVRPAKMAILPIVINSKVLELFSIFAKEDGCSLKRSSQYPVCGGHS